MPADNSRASGVTQTDALSFAIGDAVVWSSQSAGMLKVKTGTVIAVVPARVPVNEWLAQCGPFRVTNPGQSRNHVSYVVRARGRTYWPRVSLLRPATVGSK